MQYGSADVIRMFSSPSLGSLWEASELTVIWLVEMGSALCDALRYGIAQYTRSISYLRVHEIASKAVDQVKAEAKEANDPATALGTGELR